MNFAENGDVPCRVHGLHLLSSVLKHLADKHVLLALSLIVMSSIATPVTAAPVTTSFVVDGRVALNSLVALVESELHATAQLLDAFSTRRQIRSANWATMQESLRDLQKNLPSAAAVWFVRPDGSYFTADQGLEKQKLSDRPYFSPLMTGKIITNELVISRSTGARAVVVAVPVRDGDRVIGGIGVSLAVEKLSSALDGVLKLPLNMVFYALDSSGRAALHRSRELMFEYPSDLGGASLKNAVNQMLKITSGSVEYNFRGVKKLVIYQRSSKLDWVFALGASYQVH